MTFRNYLTCLLLLGTVPFFKPTIFPTINKLNGRRSRPFSFYSSAVTSMSSNNELAQNVLNGIPKPLHIFRIVPVVVLLTLLSALTVRVMLLADNPARSAN